MVIYLYLLLLFQTPITYNHNEISTFSHYISVIIIVFIVPPISLLAHELFHIIFAFALNINKKIRIKLANMGIILYKISGPDTFSKDLLVVIGGLSSTLTLYIFAIYGLLTSYYSANQIMNFFYRYLALTNLIIFLDSLNIAFKANDYYLALLKIYGSYIMKIPSYLLGYINKIANLKSILLFSTFFISVIMIDGINTFIITLVSGSIVLYCIKKGYFGRLVYYLLILFMYRGG
jgi:hypothetical protein